MKMYPYHRRFFLALGVVCACALSVLWLAQAVSTNAQVLLENRPVSKPSTVTSAPSACEPGFVTENSTNHGADANSLMAVSAVSASDIWAVGSYLNSSSHNTETLIEHWDGSSWSVVASPNKTSTLNMLLSVRGTTNNMWAVGYYVDSSPTDKTLAEHWDGTSWAIVSSPNPGTTFSEFQGVGVGSTTNAWAVGSYVDSNGSHSLVEHWDGSAWTVVASASPSDEGVILDAVRIVSTNNVWAAGYYYSGSTFHTLVEHWDGSAWTLVASPDHGADGGMLYGLTQISSDDIWAVGAYYDNNALRFQTLTEHWDGSAWTIKPSFNRPSIGDEFDAVSANASDDVWAVGESSATGTRAATLVEHWDGTSWTEIPSGNPTTSNRLLGVDASSASNVVAVGYYEGTDAERTLVETLDPCLVTPTPTVCAVQFSDVPAGSTYYSNIHCLACLGIISGYPDGTFKPNNNVTRGQLSKIVSNAADLSQNQTVQQFQDVPLGSTYFQFVGRLVSNFLISGYPCGGVGEPCVSPGNLPYFRPNANATRAQITKIDANAAGFSYGTPSGQQFEDVPVGSTYYTYTYALVARSIMGGYPCGGAGEPCVPPGNLAYFRPSNNATRGQTSKIVGNSFFPDCQASARAK